MSQPLRLKALPLGVAVAVVLIGIGTVGFGWPGIWALVALVPAFFIGVSYGHFRRARANDESPRPGVIGLGGFFGAISLALALAFFSAAARPVVHQHSAEQVANVPRAQVWSHLKNPAEAQSWSGWLRNIEAVGRASGTVGDRYRLSVLLESRELPTEIVLTQVTPGASIAWSIDLGAAGPMANLRESIELTDDASGGTRIKVTITYDVPTVLGRVVSRIGVSGPVKRAVHHSALGLAARAGE